MDARKSSGGYGATVDDVVSPADERASVRGQKGDQLRHFLGTACPTQGNASKQLHDPLPCGVFADAAGSGDVVDHSFAPEVSMKPGEIVVTRTPFGATAFASPLL